jgi:hypothetical protein
LTLSTVYFRITAGSALAPVRAPLLERLLARADPPERVADWRAAAFQVIAPQSRVVPAVATAASCGHASSAPGKWALLATPVHLEAGPRSLHLPAGGMLELEPDEAQALAADFNRVFAGDAVRLVHAREALLLCQFDAPLEAATTDPEQLVGGDVFDSLPRGADAPRLRRLASEIEMWLFEHDVNARRRARAAPAISSLWLWGGGALDAPLPAVEGWTAGNDPLFAAFPRESRYPRKAQAAGARQARPGVVVIADFPGTPDWWSAEQCFLAPALADLKARRLRGIEISAGQWSFRLSARGLARFWRKPQPWWQTLGAGKELAQDD